MGIHDNQYLENFLEDIKLVVCGGLKNLALDVRLIYTIIKLKENLNMEQSTYILDNFIVWFRLCCHENILLVAFNLSFSVVGS